MMAPTLDRRCEIGHSGRERVNVHPAAHREAATGAHQAFTIEN
jgi:hypothetical protein